MCLWPDTIMFSLSGGLQTSLTLCMQANLKLHAGLGSLNICSNELLPQQSFHSSHSLWKSATNDPLTSLFYHNIKDLNTLPTRYPLSWNSENNIM